MPQKRIPSLRRHKPSSLGVVTLNGQDVYLGHWPVSRKKPPGDVQAKYDALIAEWLASGRVIVPGCESQAVPLTIADAIEAFWRPGGKPHERAG